MHRTCPFSLCDRPTVPAAPGVTIAHPCSTWACRVLPRILRMSTARRTALASLAAAVVLAVLKLVVGLASGSLGILAEAVHSGTDAVAALLTVYAVGVAERPPDPEHQFGHGKALHLS